MKVTGLSRVSKEIITTELEKELKSRPILFVAEHGTLSATKIDKLRAKLRGVNTRYFVVKNTLGRRAFEKANLKPLSESLSGSSGVALSNGDPVASSKALMDFAKENEVFKVKAGYMNGEMIGADKIKILAELPSREVLIAKALGGMKAPIQGLVGTLSGTLRKVVTVIDAIAKKKAQ